MSTIAELETTVEALLDRIEALENRTIIEVNCESCYGSGQTVGNYGSSVKCSDCRGIGHTFALSPLET